MAQALRPCHLGKGYGPAWQEAWPGGTELQVGNCVFPPCALQSACPLQRGGAQGPGLPDTATEVQGRATVVAMGSEGARCAELCALCMCVCTWVHSVQILPLVLTDRGVH